MAQVPFLSPLPLPSMQTIDLTTFREPTFLSTRSRVVRFFHLPAMAEVILAAIFNPHNRRFTIPQPISLWELKKEYGDSDRSGRAVWAVFSSHDEARAALEISGRAISVTTALESDLEPFHKLQRFTLAIVPKLFFPPSHPDSTTINLPPPRDLNTTAMLDISSPYLPTEYTLSTNPPNPKTTFRLGDWICPSPKCAAHNFGRNISCIGCGCPRSSEQGGQFGVQQQHLQSCSSVSSGSKVAPSPRFNAPPNSNNVYYSSGPLPSQPSHHLPPPTPQHQPPPQSTNTHSIRTSNTFSHPRISPAAQKPSSPLPNLHLPNTHGHNPIQIGTAPGHAHESTSSHSHVPSQPPKLTHPLLTPSGRAFAVGGKVQNVSSDPLSPCIMYWPDNEPFPEQGQIRPSGLVGVAQPPILNTGNRGPISHQPGDWICQKCNYLNWRRRKVCQTCLPYAEGNGDSISAAVQAERIALLTSVLAQTQISGNIPTTPSVAPRTLTPPQIKKPFIDLTQPQNLYSQPSNATSTAPQQPPVIGSNRSVHRSQSHYSLGSQFNAAAPSTGSINHHHLLQPLHSQVPPFQPSVSPVGSRYLAPSPIYETSGHPRLPSREPSPLYVTGPDLRRASSASLRQQFESSSSANGAKTAMPTTPLTAEPTTPHFGGRPAYGAASNVPSIQVPAPLLPSFLQDIVQSPALSPTSTTTSSADLSSVEEYDDLVSPRSVFPIRARARGDSGSSGIMGAEERVVGDYGVLGGGGAVPGSGGSPVSNIWRLDGAESKTLSAFPLPNSEELKGWGKKPSQEGLRT
ncbi:hypothetical protein BJ165DRAFT_1399454 [Panaeolus papilionaceus]|nr:hypothetical protein BJ165DRAFT_1399454 [Panaeolus papilionaceus]